MENRRIRSTIKACRAPARNKRPTLTAKPVQEARRLISAYQFSEPSRTVSGQSQTKAAQHEHQT